METKDVNTLVRELVMGLPPVRPGNLPLSYTSDPAADYLVLQHVRETWEHAQFRAFLSALSRIQAARLKPFMRSRGWGSYPDGSRTEAMYEPGDYARAALSVVDGG